MAIIINPLLFHPLKTSLYCYSTELLRYIPKHRPVQENEINQLREFISTSSSLLILTGAGISTESGKQLMSKLNNNIIFHL